MRAKPVGQTDLKHTERGDALEIHRQQRVGVRVSFIGNEIKLP
jgi:hypothetical protein